MGGKKFGILLCAEDSDHVRKTYGGYYGVYSGFLKEDEETWTGFKVANLEFPSEDEIYEYDGFVITGSCSDADGTDIWITELVNLVQKLIALRKKVLGICFGHQILGLALGGKTGRASGWDIGITKVHLHQSQIFSSLNFPDYLKVLEFHRDEIKELPQKAEILAWSDKTKIEMFKYEDYVLGIQGHPEYNKDIVFRLVHHLSNWNYIEESLAHEAISALKGKETDKEPWKKLCISFLKGDFDGTNI